MDTVTKINAWDYIDLTRINASTLTEILLQSGYVITGIDNVSFSHITRRVMRCLTWKAGTTSTASK